MRKLLRSFWILKWSDGTGVHDACRVDCLLRSKTNKKHKEHSFCGERWAEGRQHSKGWFFLIKPFIYTAYWYKFCVCKYMNLLLVHIATYAISMNDHNTILKYKSYYDLEVRALDMLYVDHNNLDTRWIWVAENVIRYCSAWHANVTSNTSRTESRYELRGWF